MDIITGILYVSAASIWEMAIKINNGKLQLNKPLKEIINIGCKDLQCKILSIQLPHILQVSNMPNYHKAPFDRIIIAQSMVAGFGIISKDRLFDAYSATKIW